MTLVPGPGLERLCAVLVGVMAVVCCSVLWLRAGELQRRADDQARLLAALAMAEAAPLEPARLAAAQGLFPGRRLHWVETPLGPALQLLPAPGTGR